MPDATRVLVVTTSLAPDHLQTWRCASERPGIELHLAGSLRPDSSERYHGPVGIPTWGTTHVLAARGLVGRGRLWWRLDGLEDLIGSLRPDVVHVHSEAWGLLVGQALRADASVVAHGAENVSLDHGNRVEAALRRRVTRQNASRLAGYASWNERGVELLRANGLRPEAASAVAPAIVPDPAPYVAVVPHRRSVGEIRVGYIGRLVPEKGVHWLIAALDALPDVTLVVAGDGPAEADLRRQAARRGVASRWLGAIRPDAVADALADLDIVVVPSLTRAGWSEQFGRVVCEAMLAGVPVIASDSGSLAEVVGTGGIMVPELDIGALRRALDLLISHESLRTRMGAAGRERALGHLTPDAAAASLHRLWDEVAAA